VRAHLAAAAHPAERGERERDLQDRFQQVQETLPRIYVKKIYLLSRVEREAGKQRMAKCDASSRGGAYLEFSELAGPGASLLVVDAVDH